MSIILWVRISFFGEENILVGLLLVRSVILSSEFIRGKVSNPSIMVITLGIPEKFESAGRGRDKLIFELDKMRFLLSNQQGAR